jgi:m7GpppX diphosphatase
LRLFIFEKELNNNPQEKSIILLGKVKGDPTSNKAIAIISKTEFTTDQVKEFRKIKQFEQDEYFHNNIFRKYWLKLGDDTNKVQCNFIYPATEELIAKYSRQQVYSIRESPEVYNKVTKQYISTIDSANVEWMHNVLDNKKETELCVFENDHFKL